MYVLFAKVGLLATMGRTLSRTRCAGLRQTTIIMQSVHIPYTRFRAQF